MSCGFFALLILRAHRSEQALTMREGGAVMLVVGLAAVVCSADPAASALPTTKQPNVLILFVDDWGWVRERPRHLRFPDGTTAHRWPCLLLRHRRSKPSTCSQPLPPVYLSPRQSRSHAAVRATSAQTVSPWPTSPGRRRACLTRRLPATAALRPRSRPGWTHW